MNARFIESCHSPMIYERKPESKSSFFQKSGKKGILPERISWETNSFFRDSNKLKGKINAIYRRAEDGLYKMLNNGKVHTSIWGFPDYPEFYGYGIIYKRHNVHDLLILFSDNKCSSSFEIHMFRGMGKPEYLDTTFRYLRGFKNKKPQ